MPDPNVVTGFPLRLLVAAMSGETHPPVVYFLRMGEQVKIGTTTRLRARIRGLALPWESLIALIPGGDDVESATHYRFREYRIPGTEWFTYASPIRDFLISGEFTAIPPQSRSTLSCGGTRTPDDGTEGYTLAEAARAGIVPMRADALRQAKRRDPRFPAGTNGRWTAEELQRWHHARPGPGGAAASSARPRG